ncbi:MAG TPA: hypothetical protein VLC09_08110 [Polyangiaceae bacterium]|nr:hypothetical protein [Polyangiaceae bacterium]
MRLRALRFLATAASLATFAWAQAAAADPSALPPEVGYNYGEVETPRMTAVGGATRATGIGTTALFSNPANMAAAQVYHVTAMAQIHPEAARQSYGGGIVDSVISSSGVAGGVGGLWNQQDPEGVNREWTDFRAALAMPIADVLFVGASGRAFAMSQRGLGPLGQSYVSGGIPDSSIINTFTFDMGATLRPVPEFSIALVGHNLTNPDTALLPLMGAVALGAHTKDFALGADAVLESRTFGEAMVRFQGGGEVLIADVLTLRAGYRFDQGLATQALSGGLGYVDRRFSVDASVRRSVVGYEYTAISFGFTLHIEALGLGAEAEPNY